MENQEIITRIVVVLGILIGLFSVSFIIFFIVSRNKSNQLFLEKKFIEKELQVTGINTQEATMSSIGKELHDNVGQLLGSARMLIGITERNLDTVPPSLQLANETLGKAIHEIRSLSRILNKDWLEQFSFSENLSQEINRINQGGIVRIISDLSADVSFLESEEQVFLFRMMQEAFQNALRHSGATEIQVSISANRDTLQVRIHDNGRGFGTDKAEKTGIGLLNMQHRASLLNGSIRWNSVAGQGVEVVILIPFKQTSR